MWQRSAAVCVQVAEVKVDVETGQVKLLQLTSAHSTGTMLNPLMHQAQIDCPKMEEVQQF